MMLTIAGVASIAAIINAIFPVVSRASGAITTSSAKVNDRLRSDIEIIHAVGELDSSGAFADTNANGRFEIFVWVKNVGDTRILSLEEIDVFVGQIGSFERIPHQVEVESGVPILSKIPILKRLYSARTLIKDEQVLLILIKPKIIIQSEAEQEAFPTFGSR